MVSQITTAPDGADLSCTSSLKADRGWSWIKRKNYREDRSYQKIWRGGAPDTALYVSRKRTCVNGSRFLARTRWKCQTATADLWSPFNRSAMRCQKISYDNGKAVSLSVCKTDRNWLYASMNDFSSRTAVRHVQIITWDFGLLKRDRVGAQKMLVYAVRRLSLVQFWAWKQQWYNSGLSPIFLRTSLEVARRFDGINMVVQACQSNSVNLASDCRFDFHQTATHQMAQPQGIRHVVQEEISHRMVEKRWSFIRNWRTLSFRIRVVRAIYSSKYLYVSKCK